MIGGKMKMIKKLFSEMNNIKKIFLFLIIIVVIFIIVILAINVFNNQNSDNNIDNNQTVQKIDQMENYDYYLDDNATEYYKELYDQLKIVLNNEEINEEDYAKIVSKLFVADLFTLNNKLTSNDIGGLQFVYSDFKEDFINIAKTTLYSIVESNIYGDRNQELPIVSDVQVVSIQNSSFSYQNDNYDSYSVKVQISYQNDLGYPSEYNLTLIKNDKYLQVAASE